MKISIVTVVFNRVNTIEQTIQSVIVQSYDDIEYIIIDGGSTDGTKEVIQKYADKISIYVSEPDSGIYNAFNKGLKMATGDYIQYLGSDDFLYNADTISQVASVLNKSDPDVLSAGIVLVDETYKIEHYSGNEFARIKSEFKGDSMIPHPGMFVRTKLMKQKGFDESFKIAADYNFFLEIYYDKSIKFDFVDFPVAYFSLSGISSNDKKTRLEENIKIWKRFNLWDNIKEARKKQNGIVEKLKYLLQRLHIFKFCKMIINRLCGWNRHKCNNSYCRWCKK